MCEMDGFAVKSPFRREIPCLALSPVYTFKYRIGRPYGHTIDPHEPSLAKNSLKTTVHSWGLLIPIPEEHEIDFRIKIFIIHRVS